MTAQVSPTGQISTPDNSKEINFRAQEKALKDHYERQLANERAERERIAKELELAKRLKDDDDDTDAEPYVDHKKLAKTLNKFGQQHQQQTQTEIQKAVQIAREEAKKEAWLENNQDFYEVLQHAEKLAKKSPALANSILAMPDNFERQKLVYQNIKEFGLHKPEEKQSTIQDKIEANKRGQFYQPSGVGSAPYQGQTADFSEAGQKAAYEKMKNHIKNVRIG